ncbi:unnamed protein product [Mortierella alpina]
MDPGQTRCRSQSCCCTLRNSPRRAPGRPCAWSRGCGAKSCSRCYGDTHLSTRRTPLVAPKNSRHGSARSVCTFTLDFDMRICPRLVSRILKSLSSTPFPALRSLRLQDSIIRTDEFVDAIQHLPGLRAVDLKDCQLNVHPLNLLAQNSLIESIAFTQDDVPLDPKHANVFASWPHLKDLSIKGIYDPNAIGPTLILQEVIDGSDLQLRSLELEDLPTWSGATVSRLIANSPRMQKLWLKRCRVPKDTTYPSSLVSLQIIPEEHVPGGLLAILEAKALLPHLRIIKLSRAQISPDRLAMMFPSLQVLWLGATCFSFISPAAILRSFPLLRRLHVGNVSVSWSDLYLEGGGQLEELTFGAVRIAKERREPQRSQSVGTLQNEFYAHLGRLTTLRRLELNFLLTGQKQPPSVHQLGRLSRLEHLTLMGGGSWTFQDVQWLAGSLVDLEVLRCRGSEMSTPLWSWLRLNRPDLKVVIS